MSRLPTILFAWATGLCITALHCTDTTGGQRTSFVLTAQATGNDTQSSLGYTLHFDEAFLVVGQMRWYEGEPLFGWRWLPTLGLAAAHPGHYVAGEALADTQGQYVLDLLAGNQASPIAVEGITHTANSATLDLPLPDSSLGAALEQTHHQTLWLRGTATRDGRTVQFHGGLTLQQSVEGIPAHGEITLTPTPWRLSVQLVGLLDRVDFSAFPDGSDTDIATLTQSLNAFTRGASSGANYRFTPVNP